MAIDSAQLELSHIIEEIPYEMRQCPDRGKVATYITELARFDPTAFGLLVIAGEATVTSGGYSEIPFSTQTVSKVFTMVLALGLTRAPYGGTLGVSPRLVAFGTDGLNVLIHRELCSRWQS